MSNFRVGQKVVCMDDAPRSPRRYKENFPKKGVVYTVRGFDPLAAGVSIFLEEVCNEPKQYNNGYGECSFRADRFRPAVERKTDTGMAILKSILEDADNYKVTETV